MAPYLIAEELSGMKILSYMVYDYGRREIICESPDTGSGR